MIFRVLGPIEVRYGDRALPVGGGRERLVLVTLLLNAGRLITADKLIDTLWAQPPPSARAQLHNMISKLRRRLRVGDDKLIVSQPVGYELALGSHEFDLLEFRGMAQRGRRAATEGDHVRAVTALAEALSLWRGPALGDLPDDWVMETRRALHEERFAAAEARLEAELVLGHHEVVLAELPALIAEHPFRESLHRIQLLALLDADRRADALAAYQRVYRQFVDQLGVEPGESLRDLHQRALRGEAPAVVAAVPHQLPPLLGVVTGRDELLGAIVADLRAGASVPDDGRPRVAVLVGPGGVGKTCLALAAGHELGGVFSDGQLFADLRGSTECPADPHAVTGRFLRALGVGGSTLPDDRDERIAMYRSRLSGTRTLVVLDDAGSEEQVRPLLPAAARCGALITSRRQLGALMIPRRWTVPVLSPDHAVELLARAVGADRVDAELVAAAAVSVLCGRLPLAVSIAGARLAAHPDWTFAEFRQRLADERSRLDELAVGDLDVRASIALSYDALTPELRRLFRRLGLVAAPDFPAWVAQELTGDMRAARMLEALAEVHMVEPAGRDVVGQARFRLHDLVGDFARERAHAEEGPRSLADAVSRMLSGWLALISHADELIDHGAQSTVALAVPPLPGGSALPDRATVLDWCEWERTSLTTAVDLACRQGQADVAGRLALRLSGFLMLQAYGDDRDRTLRNAIASVGEDGDNRLLLRLLNALFLASLQRSRNAELPAIAERELALARQLREPEWHAAALHHAGVAALMTGRLTDSARWFTEAVDVARAGRLPGRLIARSLRGLADVQAEAGDAEGSLPLFEQARTIQDEDGRSRETAILLRRYGMALLDAGQPDAAEDVIAEGMSVAREIGDEFGVATIEQTYADVEIRRGRLTQAAARLNRLLAVHDSLANPEGVAAVLRSLADLAIVEDRWPDAVSLLCRAVEIRRRVSQPLDIARVLARLARAHTVAGDATAAAACRTEYQRILADLRLDPHCLFRPPVPLGAAGQTRMRRDPFGQF